MHAYTCIPSNLLTFTHTHTHTHTHILYVPDHIFIHFPRYNILTKNIVFICLQMNMLTLNMKFTHLHTHTQML